jgi:glucose/arabinose dehydrogenase
MRAATSKAGALCAVAIVLTATACDSSGLSSNDGGAADLAMVVVDDGDVAMPPLRDTCKGPAFPNVWTADPKLCVVQFASGLGRARQMAFAPNEDLFVATDGEIVAVYDADGDGVSSNGERFTFATQAGLNHGIAFSPDFQWVYASSDTTVYRWRYAGGRAPATGAAETVIRNIPGGGHVTRTLLFDRAGRLLVSVGSAGNLDTSANDLDLRAQIRAFNLSGATLPIDYPTGTKVATGMRNEVGLTIDSQGVLWGVENGRDNTRIMETSVVNENPAEEINRIPTDGKFYGYPYCWTEYNLPANLGGLGPGTQHADEEIPMATRKTDDWCRDTANVVPPSGMMQAHWAPLGIVEYTMFALPYRGDFLIAAHGSWNRTPATGRVIARARRDATGGIAAIEPIVGELSNGQLRQGQWGVRPVDVRVGPDQALYFSDDLGGRVLRVGYRP